MTAVPARVGGPSPRDPSRTKSQTKAEENDRARRRTAGAERAYARRAQRAQNLRGGVPAPQQKSASKAPFVVLVMLVLGAGIAGIMYFSTQAAADTYRLQEARAEAEKLTLRMEQLRREVALLESPTDLARRAGEMGLVEPSNPARLRLNPDGSIEEFGKPSAPTKSTPPPPPSPETSAGTPAPPSGQQPPAGQNQTPPAGNQTPPAGG